MEEIYTVRVKWRPDPGLSFPSERAYSSSTVGGLATAHLVLAALAATLSSLGYSASPWRGEFLGGVILVAGALGAGATGLLAWRRWYMDRHIRWFLGGSAASCLTSAASAVLTIALLLAIPSSSFILHTTEKEDPISPTIDVSSNENYTSSGPYQFLGGGNEVGELRREIYVHLLLSALVELVWSILSVRLAWKGSQLGRKKAQAGKEGVEPRPPSGGRPDILQNVRREDPRYADVVRELCRLQKGFECTKDPPPGLPLPESQQEYGQRMERFLSGVATLS